MMEENIKTGVLQLVNGELYGGAERIQEIILDHLDRDKFEPYCVALMDGDFVKLMRDKGLEIDVLQMRGKTDISIIPRAVRYVLKKKVDIIHTHIVRTNLIGRAAGVLTGTPVITHVHSSPMYETDKKLKRRINQFLETSTRRFAENFICVSNQLKGQLSSEGVDYKDIEVVKNGIELDRFDKNNHELEGKGNDFKLKNPKSPILTMVAYFRPLKGVEVLLDSLALIDQEEIQSENLPELILVGEFESRRYKREVEGRARKLGIRERVHFIGFSSKVEEILQSSDIFVLPSLFGEGIPVSLLEALAMKVPVIASATGGIPEVIKDGETGFLVPPGEKKLLAEAISSVVSGAEPVSEIVKNARKFVELNHSAGSMVGNIEDIYSNILTKSTDA